MKRIRKTKSERGECRWVEGLCVFCMKSFPKDVSENYVPNDKKSLLLKNQRTMKFLTSKLEIEEPKPFGFNFVSECIPLCPSCRTAFDQLHQLVVKLQAIQMQIEMQVHGIRKTVISSPNQNFIQPSLIMQESHFNLFRRLVKQKAKENHNGGTKIPEIQVKLTRLAPEDIPIRKNTLSNSFEDYEDAILHDNPVKTEIDNDLDDFDEEMGFFTLNDFGNEREDLEEGNLFGSDTLVVQNVEKEEIVCTLEVAQPPMISQETDSTVTPCNLPEESTSVVYYDIAAITTSQEETSEWVKKTVVEIEERLENDVQDPLYEPSPACSSVCDSSDSEYAENDGISSLDSLYEPKINKRTSQPKKKPSKANKKGSKKPPLEVAKPPAPTAPVGSTSQSQSKMSSTIVAEFTLEPIIDPPHPRKKWSSHGLPKDANNCLLCGKTNNSEGALIKHYKSDHPGEKIIQFKCPECDHIGSSRPQLRRHLSRRHGPPEEFENRKRYKCALCEKKFADRKGLNFHFKIHTGIKEFSCNECGKSFRHKLNLDVHVRNVHGNERMFECTLCPKKFKQKHTLEYHLGAHQGEKKFVCHICGSRRASKKGLEKHFEDHKIKTKDWVEPPASNETGIRKWRIRCSATPAEGTDVGGGGNNSGD